ncbi:AfsR/SARP family transcriptional regulator [Salinispora arenicola]|uniref:AfsR/SARP family transcriptional regulator n=1 Tax=Salinispora arenicola TaxID=168697 RepID=UPI000373FDD2|nr:BTAD domain-containing putative transcriptional regulator [Salinispora arenicola]
MRFGILGPLWVGGGEATVTAGRDRVILALMLLQAGRIVPVEELVDAVWEEQPPATARAQLQTCVSRLRQRFVALGLPSELIVTDPVGYGVRTVPGDLDVEVFGDEVAAARAAVTAGRLVDGRRHFRAALGLWRGPALGGVTGRSLRGRAQTLDEQRVTVLEECVDVELRLGHAADLLDELTGAVERHPLRDRLRGQLMLALSALGRQADALVVYRDGRRRYVEELGIEPGAELQELHQRVLAGDLVTVGRQRSTVTPVRGLPRAIRDFTGRWEIIGDLLEKIDEGETQVQLIDGMAGSGKTTLAVHLATRLADRYPDAQLFVDLHGHSRRSPLTPATAVTTLLRQLGTPAEQVPVDLEDRLALWRTELSDRRALVLLDNAASVDQVAPLLPTGPSCLMLVTSRRRLVGLDEGRPVSLPVLDLDEAVTLLGRVADPGRVAAEPEAAAEVVRRCGFLPLAIRLAGARLAHRPSWRIADLVGRLANAGDPLAEFAAGQRSVGGAFALSYAQVSPPAQRLFRLLGVHPASNFDNAVAAASADLASREAQVLLDELIDANLVEEPRPGRFRLHDLVQEYARRLLAEPDRTAERSAALERLLDHHLHAAAAIARSLAPSSRTPFVLPDPPRADLVEACLPQGTSWFDDNRVALTVLPRSAEAEGFLRHCWQLARACWWVNYQGGHFGELIDMHTVGLRAAERLDDQAAVALTLNYLASAHYRLAQFPEAITLMSRCLYVCRRIGLRPQVVSALMNLGIAYSSGGDYRRGLEYFDEAIRLADARIRRGELVELTNNKGFALALWGRYEEALRMNRLHMALARELDDLWELGRAFGHVGMVRHRMGDIQPAQRLLRAALRLTRLAANSYGEGEVLNELGVMEREAGRPEEAARLHREALSAISKSGDRAGPCACRNLLARATADQGDLPSALDLFRRVRDDAAKINHRYEQARALDGIARCLRPTDVAAARAHWIQALTLFRQLDVPERHEVQRLLTELG